MNDREKQIEEMVKAIRPILEDRTDITFIPCLDKPIAEALVNQGYRKVPEDSVVLTIAEVDEFRKDSAEVKFLKKRIQDEARKDTAREILHEVGKVCGDYQWFKNLRKQYGVETEE